MVCNELLGATWTYLTHTFPIVVMVFSVFSDVNEWQSGRQNPPVRICEDFGEVRLC